ncbi:unnamed protein product [Candidula unifasciata]|uniref:Uncharacterized protein n=1 Tax=Candidula unifasciata TaxID=100452 RepID=A0A8S3ZS52_9EUPU|nr:unnamed protein product [Candidula unifasciata]
MDQCSEQSSALDKVLGKWVEVKRVGFDSVARAMDLSAESKAFFENSTSVLGFARNGDTWTLQIGSAEAPQIPSYTFRFGQPHYSSNMDGTPLKGMVLPEGDRLVARYESIGPKPYVMEVVVPEVHGDSMKCLITIEGETIESTYKRQ